MPRLLIDTLVKIVAKAGEPDGTSREMHVTTTAPLWNLGLETGDSVVMCCPDQGN